MQNPRPLVAVRIDNVGGTMSRWKTSGVKTSPKGAMAEGKTRLRVVFHHADNKRSYAILEAPKK